MKQFREWVKTYRQWVVIQQLLMVALVLVLAIPVTGSCGDKPIVLKAITAFPKNHITFKPIPELIKRVKEESGGRLQIKWIGGPEVVKGFDQPEALRTGMIDMILYIPTSWYRPILPVADCKGLSELTAPEERASGAYALWQEVFRKHCNAEHLGFWDTNIRFSLFTIDKVQSLEDLKGKTIRVMPLYAPFIESLGASPMILPPSELYTALQRKVVDGYMWLEIGSVSFGWHEVTNFMVQPSVFRGEATVAVNLDKFQKMPADLQSLLRTTMKEMEVVGNQMLGELVRQEQEALQKEGVKTITLPSEDAEKFKSLSQQVTWKILTDRSPEYAPQFHKLSRKKTAEKTASVKFD